MQLVCECSFWCNENRSLHTEIPFTYSPMLSMKLLPLSLYFYCMRIRILHCTKIVKLTSVPEPSSPSTFRLMTNFCAWMSSILKYSNHIWGSCLHARRPCCIRVLAADGFLLCSNSQAAAYVHSPASFGCICKADVKTWNKIFELFLIF